VNDAELDRALGEAMRARPTPTPAVDLAAVAIGRARADAVRRVRRWTAVITGVAVLVAALVGVAIVRARLAGGGFSVRSDSTAGTGGSSVPYVVVGAAMAMAAIVVLVAGSAWDGDEGGLRWNGRAVVS
jgi:hypothetical protein